MEFCTFVILSDHQASFFLFCFHRCTFHEETGRHFNIVLFVTLLRGFWMIITHHNGVVIPIPHSKADIVVSSSPPEFSRYPNLLKEEFLSSAFYFFFQKTAFKAPKFRIFIRALFPLLFGRFTTQEPRFRRIANLIK